MKIGLLLLCCSLPLWAQSDPFDDFAQWEDDVTQESLLFGFFELAGARRLMNDVAIERSTALNDIRGQLKWETSWLDGQLKSTTDLYYDGVIGNVEVQIREASWEGTLSKVGRWGKYFDLKIGQQILTWGTGDFIFLNDLFPKDFQSFFSGRDDEYLKFPSQSARLSGYFKHFSLDLVVTPRFTPDNFINGEYFSFFSPEQGQNIAPEFVVRDRNRPKGAEWALRAQTQYKNLELAAYAYDGYHKSPNGTDESGFPRFYPLRVLGASILTNGFGGLVKAEYAYYNSRADDLGTLPLIPNDQSRYLLGYERELAANFTGGGQWYLERTQQHRQLLSHSLNPEFEPNENRYVWTTRLTYQALQQTLTVSAFNFYSTSDSDGYGRLRVSYSPVDSWRASFGANLFYGQYQQTFFGQFEDASNLFVSFRLFF